MYWYKYKLYPDYLKDGNQCQFVEPIAKQFCNGVGLDIGCGDWPLSGSIAHDIKDGNDALLLPGGEFDYIFSSHCLEHLSDPILALSTWKEHIRNGGILFLYLPHPDMEYWLPQNCRKHLHSWQPEEMAEIVKSLGFKDVIHSDRDLAWGYSVVGVNQPAIM